MGLLLTGCIYLDPINQRPSITIDPPPSGLAHRGDMVTFMAEYDDPDGGAGSFAWSAFGCADADDARHDVGCEATPLSSKMEDTATVLVPMTLAGGGPTQALRVVLEARDDRGAFAQTRLVLPVIDAPPTLELSKSARSYTIGTPIDVFAKYGDADDGPAKVALVWEVFTPNAQPAFTFTDLAVPQDPADTDHVTAGKTLVPQGIGEWSVRVTASDPLGQMTVQPIAITVAADQPPCLAEWQPIVPPAGETLPVTEPTLFQVPVVDDDLDVYPPVPGDPVLGTTTFAWSIKPPGAPVHQVLVGATGNSLDFDPSAFTPGDIVELRVEIFDRAHLTLPCADDLATCSVGAQPSCLQRQTWRVEVR